MSDFGELAVSLGYAVDILALALLIFCAVRGAFRGLTGELARVAGLLAALATGYFCTGMIGSLIMKLFPEDSSRLLRTIVLIAAVVAVLTATALFVRWLIDRSLKLLLDQPANALLGIVAGALRGVMLILAFFLAMSTVSFGAVGRGLFEHSVAGKTALPTIKGLRERAATP